jgi:uncharacterized protein
MTREQAIRELKAIFADQLNYSADDPTEPIDPISYRTPEGDSCLHIAAFRGDTRAISLLLDLGLDVNMKGDMGYTPLHYAKKKGHKEAYRLLVNRGARADIPNEFGERATPPS